MVDITESKKPFDFYLSTWWKDMTDELCTDGWITAVLSINGNIKYAKNAYEQLQKQNQELIKALEFYAKGKHWDIAPMIGQRVLDNGSVAREVLAKFSKGDL